MAELDKVVSQVLHSTTFEKLKEAQVHLDSIPPVAKSRIERTISGFTTEEREFCLSLFTSDELLGELHRRFEDIECKQKLIEDILIKRGD